MTTFNYPNFTPLLGNLTDKIIYEYISTLIIENKLETNSFENKKPDYK